MKLLTRTEEIILATVFKLGDNAYGVTIGEHINKSTGLNWNFGAIYSPLGRLVDSHYLSPIQGKPSKKRGGRRKIFYRLTEKGKESLLEIQQVNSAVWLDMPNLRADAAE